jgi:hypothetical protein
MARTELQSEGPRIDRKFVTPDGNLTETAYALLAKLLRRTGGFNPDATLVEIEDLAEAALTSAFQPAQFFETPSDVVQSAIADVSMSDVAQPAAAASAFPDVAQPADAAAMFPDVMQSACCSGLMETTWQT